MAEDQEKIDLEGAIISFKESKVYRSEGTYTANDKRLFMLKPIDDKLNGAKVAYEGKVYSVEDNTENAKFTGVYAYTLKFCSAFKNKEHDYDLTDAVWKLEQRLDGTLVEKAPTPPPDENMTESIEKLGFPDPFTVTWSITALSDDNAESVALAMKAREWLELVGQTYLNDNKVIVQSVGAITNRDNILTYGYEYRNGFDCVFWCHDEVKMPETEEIKEVVLGDDMTALKLGLTE